MQLTSNFPFKLEPDTPTLSVPISKPKLHNEFNSNYNSTSCLTVPKEYSIGNDIFIPLSSPSNSRLSVSICPLYEHEDEHDENISHQSRISHQPSHITSVTSDKTDENLIMIDDYNDSMSDSMSDDTETHNLSYTPHAIIHHDELSPVSESQSESDQYIDTLFENNSNRKCKKKNLSDIIVNHTHSKGQLQIQEKFAKQSTEIDNKLSRIISSMSSMTSNPEIMRLQEQLSNLSEKIKATQLTTHMQLLNNSSFLSNKTQRITGSYVSSYISSKASDDSNDDNITTLVNVPSTPAFYGFNSLPQLQSPLNQPLIKPFTPTNITPFTASNITPFPPSNITPFPPSNVTPFTPSNQEIINTCTMPTMSVPCIDKYKHDYWGSNEMMFPDVDKMKENKLNVDKMSNDTNNNEKQKCKKKNSKKIRCDNIAEMKLLKRKKKTKKKKQNGMCIWPSFKCFDLRACMKNRKVNIKKSEKR